jgi:hypothetical protein
MREWIQRTHSIAIGRIVSKFDAAELRNRPRPRSRVNERQRHRVRSIVLGARPVWMIDSVSAARHRPALKGGELADEP